MTVTLLKATDYTLARLAGEVAARLDETYALVYASYDDKFSDEVVAALVAGENVWETNAGDDLMRWESEEQWRSAAEVAERLAHEVLVEWSDEAEAVDGGADAVDELRISWRWSPEFYDTVDMIRERDESDWFATMMRNTGRVLLRAVLGEVTWREDLFSPRLTAIRDVAKVLGVRTRDVMHTVYEVIPETGLEWDKWAAVQVVAYVDLADYCDAARNGDPVTLDGAHLVLGNPVMGSGFDAKLPVPVTLPVDKVSTDKDAPGYSWDEVCGLYRPAYNAEVVAK